MAPYRRDLQRQPRVRRACRSPFRAAQRGQIGHLRVHDRGLCCKLLGGQSRLHYAPSDRPLIHVVQKYGSIAFDPGQKAVLTSCVLSMSASPALQECTDACSHSQSGETARVSRGWTRWKVELGFRSINTWNWRRQPQQRQYNRT